MEVGYHGRGDEEEALVRGTLEGDGVSGHYRYEVDTVTQDIHDGQVDNGDGHLLAAGALRGDLSVAEHEVVYLTYHERERYQDR